MKSIIFKGKIKAKVLTVILCMIMLFDTSFSAMAVTYPNSSTWIVHFYKYDSKLNDSVRVVSSGNGYHITCTAKNGDCAYNIVTITCTTNAMSEVKISEINRTVAVKPSAPYGEYVEFNAKLSYGSGTLATNEGKIERI